MTEKTQLDFEREIGSLDPGERREGLKGLSGLVHAGAVALVPELPISNCHVHTVFSFNAYGYSPSAFAWEAKKRGLYAAGIVDFDVLHGADEFLAACAALELRGVAGIESRVFIPEWADREINSPKEPGIFYFMGCGFLKDAPAGSHGGEVLRKMAGLARKRNEEMLAKLNAFLRDVQVDYERDVLPLTPSGNATERHMLVALEAKARQVFPDPEARARYWAQALSVKVDESRALVAKPAELQMLIRGKLMKHGGPGYVIPEAGSFPKLDEAIPMVLDLGAVPTATWLDGTSEGEKDAAAFLDFLTDKGIGCLNVIPDRNWNIQDSQERERKIFKLHEMVVEAQRRHLPVIAGTEMNKQGQKFVDDFFAAPLRPVADEFARGARIMVGHTLLLQQLGFGLISPEVRDRFRGNLASRNEFFDKLGALIPSDDPRRNAELRQAVREAWGRA